MREETKRQWTTTSLVVGAMVLGMVLAGGIGMTPLAWTASDDPGPVMVSPATSGLPSFADLAAKVSPAVVSIRAVSFEEGFSGNPFEMFFRQRRGPQEEPEERRQESGGSGFLISADGLIATNNHVVEGAAELEVTVGDRTFPAEVRGTDPATDIALIQVKADEPLTYLRLGDSDALRVGDWVMAIGSPLRLDSTVTVGVVSAKGRALGLTDRSFEDFIQTDAAINFGNSGGPLLNLSGEVIGINTAINVSANDIGFAVPVATLKQILPQLRDEGRVRRGYLGVDIQTVDREMAEAFGLESARGALVQQVREGTPAADAGLEHGDIITRIDGEEILDTRDLIDYVAAQSPGETVDVELMRGGKLRTLKVELGERPGTGMEAEAEAPDEDGGIEWLDITYQTLTPELRQQLGAGDEVSGVVVRRVGPRSPIADRGVAPGDVVAEVNGQSVEDTDSFERLVGSAESGDVLRLYLQRIDPHGGPVRGFFVFVRVP